MEKECIRRLFLEKDSSWLEGNLVHTVRSSGGLWSWRWRLQLSLNIRLAGLTMALEHILWWLFRRVKGPRNGDPIKVDIGSCVFSSNFEGGLVCLFVCFHNYNPRCSSKPKKDNIVGCLGQINVATLIPLLHPHFPELCEINPDLKKSFLKS